MESNIEAMGLMLDSQMKRVSRAAVPVTVELGKITSGGGLKIDSFPNVIPRGEYMVDLRLTTSTQITTEEASGHKHGATLPSQIRPLNSGDRVLVIWAGNEPIVVATVVGS